jgi:phosphate transport system substrate-binding protein
MERKLSLLAATCLAVTVAMSGVPAAAAAETVLKTGGTGFGLELMKILGEAYEKSHPGVRITIVPSLGSSGGIKALLNGALDFALSGRPLKEEEKAQGANATELVRSPYVFIVNSKVKKQSITTPELERLFSGQTASWPDGTPVRLLLRPETESDTAIVKGLSPAMAEAVNTARAREGMIVALTDQESASAVEKINGALGGSTLTQVLTEKRQVRVLSLNGVKPSVKGISDGTYPLAKPLYLVTVAKAPEAARQFIAFIGSKAGRKILAKYANLVVEGR